MSRRDDPSAADASSADDGQWRPPAPEPDAEAWARAEAEAKAEAQRMAGIERIAEIEPTADAAEIERTVGIERIVEIEPTADAAGRAGTDGAVGPDGVRATPASPAGRCPYLVADDRWPLGEPGAAGPSSRCSAVGDPAPLSERQRSLVCLTGGHVECPRYLRATNEVAATPVQVVAVPRARPTATVVGLGAVVVAAAITVAFVVSSGGLAIPGVEESPAPSPTEVAIASPSPAPSLAPSPAPSPSPAEPSAEPSADGAASPAPSAGPSPSAAPSPSPDPGVTPAPSSDRYELLEPCPDRPDCYVYTIRRGDNLFSIARYFGVPLEDVYRLNPWAKRQGIQAGDELVLPPPTR